MKPTDALTALEYLVKAKQPVMLHGSPGVGKSDVVRQLAKKLEVEVIDLRLSQLDPVDLRGVPSVDTKEKMTTWNAPDFLPRDGKGILFLDEINSAAQGTQAAAYQLVLDRKLGDYTLPEGWAIIAAGNRAADRAIVNQMATPLKNRMVHIDYEVNTDDWCSWALENDIHPLVLGYIRFRPTFLNEFEERSASAEETKRQQRIKASNAFATPRSWEFMSRLLKQEPAKAVEYELFKGTVGEVAATDFMGYLKHYRDLPDLDAILMDPKKAMVPDEMPARYAVASGLACKATPDNFERVLQYADRLQKEFQVMLVKDAVTRSKELTKTKAFTAWAIKNKDILM